MRGHGAALYVIGIGVLVSSGGGAFFAYVGVYAMAAICVMLGAALGVMGGVIW